MQKLQREAHENRREARAELVRSVSSARTEADQLRAEARGMLDRARAEVAALAKRRDDITAQLGTLSGVIEALAVPETAPSEDPSEPPAG